MAGGAVSGARWGARTAGASSVSRRAAAVSPSSSDRALGALESDTAGEVMTGAGVVLTAVDVGASAVAAGASLAAAAGVGAAAGLAGLGGAFVGAKFGSWVGSWLTNLVMDQGGLAKALGLHKVATEGDQPAVLGHKIAHQNKNLGLLGAIGGIVVGAVAAIAVVALVTVSGPLGVIAVAALAGAAGGIAGGLVASIGATLGQYGEVKGDIVQASTNVFFEGRGVARATDKVLCRDHGDKQLAEGCKTVSANGLPIVRLGHRTTCDGNVDEHVKTIYIAKETAMLLQVEDSRSKWLRWANVLTEIAAFFLPAKSRDRSTNKFEGPSNRPREKPQEQVASSTEKPGESVCRGDPIDVVTGEFVDHREDFLLPGVQPLGFTRSFANFSRAQGWLGPKWANSWSINLLVEDKLTYLQTENGKIVVFSTPGQKIHSVNVSFPYLELRGDKGGEISLFNRKTQQYYFFSFAAKNRLWLSRIVDRNENSIEFVYGSEGLRAVTRSNGDILWVESRDFRMEKAGIGEQELARYVYDQFGRLIEAHSFRKGSFYYAYNEDGYVTSWRDTKATRVHYGYDAKGRVVETRSDSGQHNGRLFFDEAQKVTRFVTPNGASTAYHHDRQGLVWKIVDAFGGEWITEHDIAGNVTAATDPLGRRTSYRYDEFGEIIESKSPSGAATRYAYNPDGYLIEVTQADGSQWRFEWDHKGNLLRRTNPLGEATAFRHGAQGETVRVDLPNGAFNSVYFDRSLRPMAVRDGSGFERLVNVDVFGRLLSLIDEESHTVRFDYAAGAGNPRGALRERRMPNGVSQTYEYDGEGQLAAFTDGEGRATRFRSGAFDLLEEIVDAKGGVLRLSYDGEAHLSSVTNQKGERYCYEYDRGGRLVREVDFGGLVTQYVYDAADQCVAKTAPDLTQTRFSYDLDGRLVEARLYRDGASKAEDVSLYSYDPVGRLLRAESKDCVVELERDALGRVVCERVNGREIRSSYDSGASRRTERFGKTSPTKLAYDADGRVASVQIGAHAPLRFERDRRGYETLRQSASGFLLAQSWDALGLLSHQLAGASEKIAGLLEPREFGPRIAEQTPALRLGSFIHRAYRWDRAFNPTEILDERWGFTRFSYDARGQIGEAQYEGFATGFGFDERFDYDAAGNLALSEAIRTRGPGLSPQIVAELAEQTFFSYDRGGRLRQRGHVSYAYDEAGRVTLKRVEEPGFRPKSWRYEWNGRGQLIHCITPEGDVWSYGYDPLGRRLWKRRESAAANDNEREAGRAYQWDGKVVAAEAPIYADGTVAWNKAVYWHHEPESFRPMAREEGERLDYVVTDHIGTPRELFDESGARLRWRQSFTVWGRRRARIYSEAAKDRDPYYGGHDSVEDELEQTSAPPPASAQFCPIRFQGQWEDAESGLYYNRFRYYDPLTGGYLSPDPIGLEGGFRPQGYVENPTAWVDPLGLAACERDWGDWYSKQTGTSPPSTMENPHAHHIVYKGDFAHSSKMQAALDRSRAVLGKYGIDPVNDPAALMWAENRGHSIANARAVADKLEVADREISSRNLTPEDATSSMKSELQRIGTEVFGN